MLKTHTFLLEPSTNILKKILVWLSLLVYPGNTEQFKER